MNFALIFFPFLAGFCLYFYTTAARVVLMDANLTLSFDDTEATFAPAVKASGEHGILHLAEPLDACSTLTNELEQFPNVSSPFVLIIRGGCGFRDKVREAQKAGFKAAIVYDDEDDDFLIAMAGDSDGVKIHAVFVSKSSGEILKKYIGNTNIELWIVPRVENSAWSIMAISFFSLLIMSGVLAICFFFRSHQIIRERPQTSCVGEFHGMSKRLVKALPSLIFTSVLEDNCTSTTCAICLEDYNVGEKLRILPCHHKFHAFCVDSWLTSWRAFCPVCKHDARSHTSDQPASECTPLLPSSLAYQTSRLGMSSIWLSSASSPATQILHASTQTPSVSWINSLDSDPESLISFQQSPSLSVRERTLNLRNASQRSQASHLISQHSLGYSSLSRFTNSNIPSPSEASASSIGSSSHQLHPLQCSESASSFSP